MPVFGRWQTKPPAGTRLDWTNPFLRNLEFAAAFAVGSGPPGDLVTNQPMIVGAGTPTWIGSQFGNALTIPAGGYYTLSGKPKSYTNVTMIYIGVTIKDAANLGRLVSTTNVNVNGFGFCLANNAQGTSPLCLLLGGVAWVMPTTAITPPSTCPVFLGISTPSPTSAASLFFMKRYDTGAITSSGTGTVASATTGPGYVAIGGVSSATSTVSNDFYLALVYSRQFSLQEFRMLSANPWQIFAPPPLYSSLMHQPFYPWLYTNDDL